MRESSAHRLYLYIIIISHSTQIVKHFLPKHGNFFRFVDIVLRFNKYAAAVLLKVTIFAANVVFLHKNSL